MNAKKKVVFQDPQPPENWTTVRDTHTYGKICHQGKKVSEERNLKLFKIPNVATLKTMLFLWCCRRGYQAKIV